MRSTPAKAGVVVDGVWRGRTPLTIKGLAVGTHAVRVVEDGYIAETRRVAVDARAAGTAVSFQLGKVRGPERPSAAASRPGVTTGRLLLESRPSGAAVLIDGRVVGTTPLLLSDLEPGARQIPHRAAGAQGVDDDGYRRGRTAGAGRRLAGGNHRPMTAATLALENGTTFEGISIGADGEAEGEVVFNTSMTGYQEVLTDPSYAGQIVTMTAPQIGNYGVTAEDSSRAGRRSPASSCARRRPSPATGAPKARSATT